LYRNVGILYINACILYRNVHILYRKVYILYIKVKQAWTGPEGSRRLRLPDFKTIGT